MSAFYPSTSASQLSLMQDMATDHCGTHAASVFSGGLRAHAHQNEPAVERHAGSLSGSRTAGFPPNFLSYSVADFRDFCPPTAADVSAAAKASPTAAAIATRHRRSDECKDDFDSGLDLTGMHEMRDIFKTAPLATVDHRPLGSPTTSSSSSSHRHPDQPPHLQHHHQMRCSELLQQQQQRHEEMFMQQARHWYLNQSPTTTTTSASAVDHAGASDLVNGRSPGSAPPPQLFRHEATGTLGDIAPGGDPHCHWPGPPTYNGSVTPVAQRQLSDQKELSPTQKAGDGVAGVPFYPWMAVVGQYKLPDCRHADCTLPDIMLHLAVM